MSSGFDVDRNVLGAKVGEIKVVKALAVEEFQDLFDRLSYEVDDVFIKDLGIVPDLKDFLKVSRKLLLLHHRESELVYKFVEKYADDLDFFDESVDFSVKYEALLDAYLFFKKRGDSEGVVFFRKKILVAVRDAEDDLVSFRIFFKDVTGDEL